MARVFAGPSLHYRWQMVAPLHLYIGNKAYSSWSLRPWLAARVAGIPFEETIIPLYEEGSPERMRAVSPVGKVPVLHHGDVVVWESLAIVEYLAEQFPDRRLWPEDSSARAVARAVSSEMHAGFSALRTNMGMNVRRRLPGRGRAPGVAEDIARITALWADCRARFGAAGPFLFGHFTIADAMFAPVVTRFETYVVELPAVARAYSSAVLALPAMKEWYAAAESEPWVIDRYEIALNGVPI